MPDRVGVLLVHGIGEQKRGDSIFEWAEALGNWYDAWLRGAGVWNAYHGVARADLDEAGQASQRDFHQFAAGLHPAIARASSQPQQEPASEQHSEWLGGQCALAGVVVEPDPRDPDAPARAELRLQRYRRNGTSESDTVLLAETHWADAFPAPRFGEFVSWVAKYLPMILEAHLAWGLFQARARLAGVKGRATRAHYTVELVGWHAASLLLPVVPLVGLALLLMSLPLSLIPFEAAQTLARAIRNLMANVVGDSYVLLERPARAAIMHERVATSLEWLCARCDAVVVVAHSQGAAMAIRVLAEGPWPKVRTLVTLGSGARKLAHLRAAKIDAPGIGSWWSAWLAVLLPWLVLPVVLDVLRGVAPSWLSLVIVAGVVVWFAVTRVIKGHHDPLTAVDAWMRQLHGVRITWRDMYARTDPVSNGEHVAPSEKGPRPPKLRAVEVHNRGSLVADHTTYWQNPHQCLARIARSINELLSWPIDGLTPADERALSDAWLARLGRVSALRVVRTVIWAVFVHLILSGPAYLTRLGEWLRAMVVNAPIEIPGWILRLASRALDWHFGLGRMELAGAALLAVGFATIQWAWNRLWLALDHAAATEMFRRRAGREHQPPFDLQIVLAILFVLGTQGLSLLTASVPAPPLLSLETLVLSAMFLFNLADFGYMLKYFWIAASATATPRRRSST